MNSVAIIGGGWAGLACAHALTRQCPGLAIDLYEASPAFGGRARGLMWATGKGPIAIDNGQHLTLAAYRDTFGLLREANAPAWPSMPLQWIGIEKNAVVSRSWRPASAAGLKRLTRFFTQPHAPKGWPWDWRLSLVKSLAELHLMSVPRIDSVSQWLSRRRVPHGLAEHFWRPLTESALNTEMESASLAVLWRIMRDVFLSSDHLADVRLPLRNLSLDGIDSLTAHLQNKGVALHARHRVQEVRPAPAGGPRGGADLQIRHGEMLMNKHHQAVVFALPAADSHRLWTASSLVPTMASQRWARMSYRAITTVWLAYPDSLSARIAQWPQWFLLDPLPGVRRIAQVVVRRPGALALIVSAQRISDQTDSVRDALSPPLRLQLLSQLGLDLDSCEQKWITEKNATWACTDNHPWADESERSGLTGEKAIYRAADDLEYLYPATIESAVRSGFRCADTVARNLNAI